MVQTIGSRRVTSARGRPQEASISLHSGKALPLSGEAFPARGKLGKRKVEERRDKKSSVSGMCNLVFVCILNIAMGDTSDILEQTELRCCFTVLHSDTEGSEICVNMRLCLAPLTLSGLCHGLYYKVLCVDLRYYTPTLRESEI